MSCPNHEKAELPRMSEFEPPAAKRTPEFFQRYTRDASVARAIEILDKAGAGNPPIPGDELPKSWKPRLHREKQAPT